MMRKPFPPYLALSVGLLGLAFSAIFIRWANAPGPVSAFYRMVIAGMVLAVPFGRKQAQNRSLPFRDLVFAVLGGLFFAFDLALWSSGVMLGGATLPTLMANTAPIWVGIGAMTFFREKPTPAFWIGLLLAIGGAASILRIQLAALDLNIALILGLVSGLFYAGYFLVTERGRRHLDTLRYFWISVVACALTLLVINRVLGYPLWGYPPLAVWSFIGQGLFTQSIGWMAINYAQGHLPLRGSPPHC